MARSALSLARTDQERAQAKELISPISSAAATRVRRQDPFWRQAQGCARRIRRIFWPMSC